MNTTQSKNPFVKVESTATSFTFHSKAGVPWKQINDYLEKVWGKNGKDKHWKWMGFGDEKDGFKTVMVRQHCNEYICDCEPCEKCGVYECCLEEDDDGDKVCDGCMNEDDEDEDDE